MDLRLYLIFLIKSFLYGDPIISLLAVYIILPAATKIWLLFLIFIVSKKKQNRKKLYAFLSYTLFKA